MTERTGGRAGSMAGAPVVLLDVDNTLLDNDRVQADLGERIELAGGAAARERYWALYEMLRSERGYADYLGTLERLAAERLDGRRLDDLTAFLLDYPFRDRLYANALEAIEALKDWSLPVIVSDGDTRYQPNKIRRSGIWDAVEGRVLIYVHKEQMQDEIDRLYPAWHHVMVDDKLRILAAMKAHRGTALTTVFVRQGHYAHDPAVLSKFAPADLSIERIGDLLTCDLSGRLDATRSAHRRAP
ncbi:MAG TPA: HAD family hydrolase [Vicinamibacterales bacterium]|nr:HAD family hydrolase [Vicinamibacterales bacterium]